MISKISSFSSLTRRQSTSNATAVVVVSTQQEVRLQSSEYHESRADSIGLSVHMNQVHKENLTQVENALPSRQGLEVEIFGMEGIPQDMLDQHRNRILQNFQQAQKDRQIATGNPLPGQGHAQKKIKTESPDELKQRLAEFRKRKQEIAANGGVDPAAAANTETPAQAPFVSFSSLRFCLIYANICRTARTRPLPKYPSTNNKATPYNPPTQPSPTPSPPATSPHVHHPARSPRQLVYPSDRHKADLGAVVPATILIR